MSHCVDGPILGCSGCLDELEAERDQLAQSLNVLMDVKNSVVDQRDHYKAVLKEFWKYGMTNGVHACAGGCLYCEAKQALDGPEKVPYSEPTLCETCGKQVITCDCGKIS